MQNFLLQLDPSTIQDSFNSTVTTIIDQVTPGFYHTNFITDLAFIMIIGAVVALAFFKIRQPLIIGYLFAGMLIGPLSPFWSWILPDGRDPSIFGEVGLLADISALHLFADIGVILLLFVIGIEFPYAKIRSIGRATIGVGTMGLLMSLGAIFYVATALGLEFMDALFIAAALSISSTAVIVKILEDAGKIHQKSSIRVLGILIVEDVIAVILLSSLQSVALIGTVSPESVAAVVAVAAALIFGTFAVGTRLITPLIDRVAATEHREILLLTILGICFGYALLTNVVGLSVAIGAFLAGVLVAESKSAEVAKLLSSPIKDMFVAIFFISIGALMDITNIGDYMLIAVALIAVAIGTKFGGNTIANLIFRQRRGGVFRSAFTLAAPRGEFSIVIIKTGVDIGAVSAFLFPLMGMIAIITSFLTPYMVRAGDKVLSMDEQDDDV